MNFLKKPFSISLQALAGVLIFSCLLAHPFSEAASSPPGDKRDYMLVLNTYTESAPRSSHIINSIVAHIDQVDNFEVYTESLDGIIRYRKVRATSAEHAERMVKAGLQKGWKITGAVHQFKLEEIGNGK